jgi:hypothetical protein
MKQIFCRSFLGLALATYAFADVKDLVLKAYYQAALRQETSVEGVVSLPIVIVLKNCSTEPLRVPTSDFGFLAQNSKESATVLVAFRGWDLKDGTVAIDPEARFSPVTLQPGESTVFRAQIEHLGIENINRIFVVYRVEPRFAKRYGLWTGQLESWGEEGTPFTSVIRAGESEPKHQP